MSLIACPACGKQVSAQAPSCPHCGQPIAGPVKSGGGGGGCVFGILVLIVLFAIGAFTNPTEADLRQKIAKDGWVPVSFERTNLIFCNWARITGATGAKATYLGIGGQVFKLPGSD
jgi:zinc ribbon protein